MTLIFGFVIGYHAGPETDYFYNRFTQARAKNLILGSSRAAQGIVPEKIKTGLKRDFFNFAFTNYNSPYGLCYLEAAKKKFHKEDQALTILEVSPFVLSNYDRNMNAGEEIFEECETAPSNMWMTQVDPNFEYIIRNYSEDLRTLTGIKPRPYAIYLHDDGWLEIKIPLDTAYFRKNTEDKVRNYMELIQKMKPSEGRWNALDETVSYFSEYGKVVLVRVPVSPEMEKIENEYYSDFDSEISSFAKRHNTPYLNYFHLNDSLYFTDGNHLHRESARDFSEILGADLSEAF